MTARAEGFFPVRAARLPKLLVALALLAAGAAGERLAARLLDAPAVSASLNETVPLRAVCSMPIDDETPWLVAGRVP